MTIGPVYLVYDVTGSGAPLPNINLDGTWTNYLSPVTGNTFSFGGHTNNAGQYELALPPPAPYGIVVSATFTDPNNNWYLFNDVVTTIPGGSDGTTTVQVQMNPSGGTTGTGTWTIEDTYIAIGVGVAAVALAIVAIEIGRK
jgi:hypothetical protein